MRLGWSLRSQYKADTVVDSFAPCSVAGREFVTSSYHDVFHRRLMQMLMQGSTKECAEAWQVHERRTSGEPAENQDMELFW